MSGVDRIGATEFTTPSDTVLVATRVFNAPREVIWDVWTNPKHTPNWMNGPDGWKMVVSEIDLRPGGEWHFVWRQESGEEMEMRGTYREIERPGRLVNTEAWGGEWPETVNTLELTEKNGKTTTVCTVVYPTKSALEAAIGTGMKNGWAMSYDHLDDYLRKIS